VESSDREETLTVGQLARLICLLKSNRAGAESVSASARFLSVISRQFGDGFNVTCCNSGNLLSLSTTELLRNLERALADRTHSEVVDFHALSADFVPGLCCLISDQLMRAATGQNL